jgi:phage protein D
MADKVDRGSLRVSLSTVTSHGKEIEDVTNYVKSFTYIRKEKGVDKLSLEINNQDLSNWESRSNARFMQGKYLRLSYGYQSIAAVVAHLRITKVRGSTTLEVEAKNVGDKLNRSKRTRSFKNKTRSEIVQIIAQEHGMEIALVEKTGKRYDRITQSRETDAQFCHRLAYKEGFQFSMNQSGLKWAPRNIGKKPKVELVYHVSEVGDILDLSIDMDVSKVPRRIKTSAVNRETGEVTTSEVDNNTDSNRPVLREFVAYVTESGTTHGLEVTTEQVKTAGGDGGEGKKDATARFRLAQQSSIKLGLVIIGNPKIAEGEVILVNGIGDVLSGLYLVKEIESSVSEGGYIDTLKLVADGVSKSRKAGSGPDPRGVINACVQEVGIVLNTMDSPGGVFNETGILWENLKSSIAGGKTPSKTDIQGLIEQATYNIVNLRAIGNDDAADLIANCRANLSIIQDAIEVEDKNTGTKNACFPEDGLDKKLSCGPEDDARAEARLYIEGEGEVPGTIEGGSEAIEELGITNENLRHRFLNRG